MYTKLFIYPIGHLLYININVFENICSHSFKFLLKNYIFILKIFQVFYFLELQHAVLISSLKVFLIISILKNII